MKAATLGHRVNLTATIAIGALAVVCVLMGLAIAGGATLSSHRLVRAAIVGVPLIVLAVVLIAELGLKALPIWVAVSPLAYPFLRYPLHKGGYVTFDRVWIFGLLLILLRLPRPPAQHPASRALHTGMVVLAGVYGARLLLPPRGSLIEVRYWVDAMVLPVVVYAVTRRVVFQEGADRVMGALLVAGVVMSVISVAELALGFSLAGYSGGTAVFDALAGVQRVSGPYASNAASSTAALVCLAAGVYWTRHRSGEAKLVGTIAVAITAAGALASFHRAAGIAVVAILILGTVPGARDRNARYVTVAVFGVAAALAFYVLSGTVEQSTFWQGRIQSTTNVLGRFASWDQSVAIFKEAPILGVGPGQAPVVQQEQGLFEFDGQSAGVSIHSTFLTALAENGVVGALALLALCAAVVKLILALRRNRTRGATQMLYAAVLAASAGFLVMSLTLTILLEAPAVLMFAVLLGVAGGMLDREWQDSRGAVDNLIVPHGQLSPGTAVGHA